MTFSSEILSSELPYYSDLLRIRKEFEDSCIGFPYSKCALTARAVFNDIGLLIVGGIYLPEYSSHVWNFDLEKKIYIDLTMDQFMGVNNPIVILPFQNDILLENEITTAGLRIKVYASRYCY